MVAKRRRCAIAGMVLHKWKIDTVVRHILGPGEPGQHGVESLSKLVSYSFQFFDTHPVVKSDGSPAYPDADGFVQYELLTVWGSIDGKDHTLYLQQLFSKDGLKPGKNNIDNIWHWDGNRENPTITPSFLWPDGRLHLFVRAGKLDILPDTTIDCTEVRRVEINGM